MTKEFNTQKKSAVDSYHSSNVKFSNNSKNASPSKPKKIIHAIPSKCDLCSSNFKNRKLYIEHIIECHLENEYHCNHDNCGTSYSDNIDLVEHQVMHHGYKNCYECMRGFTSDWQFDKHKCETTKVFFKVDTNTMNDEIDNKKQKDFTSRFELIKFLLEKCNDNLEDTESVVNYVKEAREEKFEKNKKKKFCLPNNSTNEMIYKNYLYASYCVNKNLLYIPYDSEVTKNEIYCD